MDKLEKFISENRDKLDRYSPAEKVWDNIDKRIRNKNISFQHVFSRAATVLAITALSFMVYYFISTGNEKDSSFKEEIYMSADLKETELYYTIKVNGLLEKTMPLLIDKPDLEKDLMNDMSELDNICQEIKSDLRDNVRNEDVIEALIRNYRAKVEILEEMLTALGEEEHENQNKISGHEL